MILSLSIICATLVCSPLDKNMSIISVSDKVEVIEENKIEVSPREIAMGINEIEFGNEYWNDLDELIEHESRWNLTAVNKYSGACGLGQRLVWNGVKYVCPFSDEQLNDPYYQLNDLVSYIRDVYNNPKEALYFWKYTSVEKKGRNYY